MPRLLILFQLAFFIMVLLRTKGEDSTDRYASAKARVETHKPPAVSPKRISLFDDWDQQYLLDMQTCEENVAGQHYDMFPMHVWMAGSGMQVNMNVNEVISPLRCRLCDHHAEELVANRSHIAGRLAFLNWCPKNLAPLVS